MDAGDADEEVVAVAVDGERVVVRVSLRVSEALARAAGRARADEATADGDPGWTRETLTLRSLCWPLTLSVSSPAPPYACAKRRRERRAARARTRRRRLRIPEWTRETLT